MHFDPALPTYTTGNELELLVLWQQIGEEKTHKKNLMREIDGKNWKCVALRIGASIHVEKAKLHKKVGIIKKNGF